MQIHQDFSTTKKKRHIKWFIRGIKPDGTRWESGHRHLSKEGALREMNQWGDEMGDMKIMMHWTTETLV